MTSLKTALVLLATVAVSNAAVYTPICGFYQYFDLTIAPPGGPDGNGNPSASCYVQGVPTKTGLSPLAEGPVSLDTPQGTGNHTIRFVVPSGYTLVNALLSSPNPSANVYSLTVDPSSGSLNYDANVGNPNDAGSATFLLYKGSTQLCQTAISFQTVTANNQLCLINNGGAGNPQINSGSGSVSFPAGNTVVVNPAAPQATVQNIIQIYQVTYNTNIVISQNVNYNTVVVVITNNTIINNNNYVYPPGIAPQSGVPTIGPSRQPTIAPPTRQPPSIAPTTPTTPPARAPTTLPARAPTTIPNVPGTVISTAPTTTPITTPTTTVRSPAVAPGVVSGRKMV